MPEEDIAIPRRHWRRRKKLVRRAARSYGEAARALNAWRAAHSELRDWLLIARLRATEAADPEATGRYGHLPGPVADWMLGLEGRPEPAQAWDIADDLIHFVAGLTRRPPRSAQADTAVALKQMAAENGNAVT